MRYNILGSTDMKLSNISLGGASFSNIYGTYDEQESIKFIKTAFQHGVNYIETGPWYGQGSSEKLIGKALNDIPRYSFFIGSKVGRYESDIENMFDFSKEKTEIGVETTLNRLGLDYVDIIQVHDLTFAADRNIILKETLPTLERAVRDGKARYIGLADYDIELMKEIVEESDVKISTILSYSKSTLIDNRLQNYVGYFKSKGIGIINAGATGMGLLTNQGPQPWHPASEEVKSICSKAAQYCKDHKVSLGRLATWFSLTQPGNDTNVCGFTEVSQLIDTLDVVDKGLNDHEAKVLNEIRERFLIIPLHWDGVELPEYKKKLELKKKHNL